MVIKLLDAHADRASRLHTDERHIYKAGGKEFATHETVSYSDDEYVRGDVTTNSVESFFAVFKRGMTGVYQHCDENISRATSPSVSSATTRGPPWA